MFFCPCSSCETSYLILRTLETTFNDHGFEHRYDETSRFVAALTPFPRFPGITILSVAGWMDGEGLILTLIELEIINRV